MSSDKAIRPKQVSLLLDDAFEEVDRTTGAALNLLQQRAEAAVPKPSSRPRASDRPLKLGRFFILMRDCLQPGVLSSVIVQLSRVGRVVDSGVGVANDTAAGWLELAIRASGVMGLRDKLKELGLNDRVEEVLEISPGQGKMQARQMRILSR